MIIIVTPLVLLNPVLVAFEGDPGALIRQLIRLCLERVRYLNFAVTESERFYQVDVFTTEFDVFICLLSSVRYNFRFIDNLCGLWHLACKQYLA